MFNNQQATTFTILNYNMNAFKTIKFSITRHIATLCLARHEKRNAINEQMAAELLQALEVVTTDDNIDMLILKGEGSSFCAGADLVWMNSDDLPEKSRPSFLLPQLFKKLFYLPKPLIVMVNGAAMGGALGLIAAADFVLAADDARFAFSEVRLGLVPATISPYVVKRIGEYNARRLMLRGNTIGAKEVLKSGLADVVVPFSELEAEAEGLCRELEQNGPEAMRISKKLIQHVSEHVIDDELIAHTAAILEKVRISSEAKEGIAAYREKRKAIWRR